MVRTVNMSQFKSKMRQIQNKAERELRQIQRDTERKMKSQITKAVNEYKRDVRKNQIKIQSELNKLNRSSKITTSYTISVRDLNSLYERVNTSYNEFNATQEEKKIYNYIEQENANNLTVANAINNPELAESVDTELQDNGIGEKLKNLSIDLNNRWIGALFSLNPNNLGVSIDI